MVTNREPRLLVDSTAGRLARWLRILGFDTEYVAASEPSRLVRLSRQSGRRIVTRSERLARRLGPQAIHLASEHLPEQLRQVIGQTGCWKRRLFSRCNICNVALIEIPKEHLAGRIPVYVYNHHDRFSACPVCGRYYWQGTHYQYMLEAIERALEGKNDG
ncbi:MAG TPA: Mut7-C RNAse domain-containing protein [bacterium]|nr:Mut7-C RNAse domain-containing protein [bacterium]